MKILAFCFAVFLTLGVAADSRIDYIKEFTGKYCSDCHDEDLEKGGLDLSKFNLLMDTLEEEKMWSLAYDRIAYGEMPPKKKKKQPTAEEKDRLGKALSSLLNESVINKQKKSGRTLVRRLTREEYENTLRELLQLPDLDIKEMLPEDSITDGFDNVSSGQDISHVNIKSYLKAAEYALDMAIAIGPQPQLYKHQKEIAKYRKFTKPHKHKRPVENGTFYLRTKKRSAVQPFVLEGFKPPYTGTYEISFRAFGSKFKYAELKSYPADEGSEQLATVFSGPKSGYRKHKTFSLPNDTCDDYITYLGSVRIGDNIAFNPSALPTAANKPPTYKPELAPAVGLKDFKITGPIYEQWPPASHKVLFDDLKQVNWSYKISKIAPDNKFLRYANARDYAKFKNHVVVSENPQADGRRLLERFMTKAFRRPVSTEKLDTFMAFFQSYMQKGFSFQDALKSTYIAVLCDPSFLFFEEKPGQLDNYALASRLSYFLWKSSPDDELMELANKGILTQSKTISAQVERMLQNPKSDQFVKSFINQWLELRKIQDSAPDETLYPEYRQDTWLEDSMTRETYAFFKKLIMDDLSAKNIIDSDFIMVNRRMAELYGFKGIKGDHFRPIKVPEGMPRGGFLTQGSILKVTANGTTTSPITRGVWMAEKVLGVHIPPPPANVPAAETDLASATTLKKQLAHHRDNPSCASCHVKIDPAGFALEKFDVMGAEREHYRTLEGGEKVDEFINYVKAEFNLGMKIDSSGEVVGGDSFKDVEEFKAILMKDHEHIRKHFLKNLITFATGSGIQFADRYELNRIVKESSKNDGLKTLIHLVTQSRLFRHK